MAFSTTNISKTKATLFPAGLLSDGQLVGIRNLILVSWHSQETDKLFQLYVEGRWAGVTSHPNQRMLLVQGEHNHPVTIEVIAVPIEERDVDYAKQLSIFEEGHGSHAVLSWPRRGDLPWGSRANIYWDEGKDGVIDYSTPLASQPIWNGLIEKWGWGMDTFGEGDFGYSGTGAVGWGKPLRKYA